MDKRTVVTLLRAAGCVYAESEADLLCAEFPDDGGLAAMVERRCAGEPLEYVVGWAEFDGMRVVVRPGVFVPRRRSELLVRLAAASVRPEMTVVDLCCGSGAVAAAVAKRVRSVDLHACDIDPVAVRCARSNLGDRAEVHRGDLFEALPRRLRGRVGLVTANAPYVPTDDIFLMPPEARDHEPRIALDGGVDGVEVHRRIAGDAGTWLTPGGVVLIETSRSQMPLTEATFRDNGFRTAVDQDPDLEATVLRATFGR